MKTLVASLAGVVVLGFTVSHSEMAVEAPPVPYAFVLPAASPEHRTPHAMLEAEATAVPARPTARRVRPTMDESAYRALKAELARRRALIPLRQAPPRGSASLTVPSLINTNCASVAQDSAFPPDVHGAVGTLHYVQVVNSRLLVYPKRGLVGDIGVACGPPTLNVSLASFFGYVTRPLSGARVMFDHVYRRWIVTATADPETDSVQRHFVAVSRSLDAAGAYFRYNFDVNIFNNTEVWDYAQLGYDATAILITANIFNPGYVGSRILLLSKPRMYAGLSVTPCLRAGTTLDIGTIAPPVVRDNNNESWFLSASPGGDFLRVTRWTATDRSCGLFLGTTDVPVPFGYRVPPDALQPWDSIEEMTFIDTLDARFVNASTQQGDLLHNIHTIENGQAILRYYRIHVPTAESQQDCRFFSFEGSDDWNASLVVNDVGHLYITYSSVASAGPSRYPPQVRFAGKQAADGCQTFFRVDPWGDFEGGFEVFTSPSILTGNPPGSPVQQWGQYSAIHIDPTSPNQAIGVNQSVDAGGATWGTRIFRIRMP